MTSRRGLLDQLHPITYLKHNFSTQIEALIRAVTVHGNIIML